MEFELNLITLDRTSSKKPCEARERGAIVPQNSSLILVLELSIPLYLFHELSLDDHMQIRMLNFNLNNSEFAWS